MPHLRHSMTDAGPSQVGGYLPLALGVSTVRYPIPERIFDCVYTVQNATAGMCQEETFGQSPRGDTPQRLFR
jgi:hypothetical protein